MPHDDEGLRALNVEIGHAEARGDKRFFEDLLAPAFAMRRATGKVEDRKSFIDAVRESDARSTEINSVTPFESNRALVVCAVAMVTPEGEKHFHNVRLFSREEPGSPWKLLAWANEPE
jgi:hypothetical protein